MKETLLKRFIQYAKLNTRSDASSSTIPTTKSQEEFAFILKEELERIGLSKIDYNQTNGFLTAVLPKNADNYPSVGLIAHLDTADFNAENITPLVHENYDGKDVLLNKEQDIVMKVSEFPNLKDYIGETLITTDGTTLLGADDKAGIVEILGAIDYFIANPDENHGDIWVAFGPDEEIGQGADHFDVSRFPADYAYTIDSGRVGHFEYETFNAAQATIKIDGTSVHPGTAYGMMVNANKVANLIDQRLPQDEVPEKTRGKEGFYLLHDYHGSIDKAEMVYIIRDHDTALFEYRKERLVSIVETLNKELDRPRIQIELKDQYYNMKEIIEKDMTSVDVAIKAMKNLGIEPIITPFRGGTDGSKISFMGLPTPNIFTGGENFHGQYEFITLEAMETATKTIIEIIKEGKS
ncbi:peptidase T [Vagococcus fluvialis]|uniref:Peptidase T n=1 Tax=Vagococcus fluvialis TaxID=2738 RepID=A0A369AS22_9ENTE|nr:peptidase T [Vagococcus fluvialis]RCX12160.1 peptidase T [Vagococcus fluvialis]RSU00333.1 peptidase T [Vagococcus fluvialis]UDM70542.1 peptidase T [Vagococcus fluvialis]UDM77960.1 peptidase T [Vagococcus fluvialis]UDM82229.1 peptidase T [Vagococcus fluvialis]